MKIAIDLTPVEKSPAGIGQYTINLVSKLIEIDSTNEYFIYTTTPRLINNSENIVIKKPKGIASGLRWIMEASNDMKGREIDYLISPSNHIFTRFFPRTIQFIHDLAPIKFSEFFPRTASIKYKYTSKIALKRAAQIVTISDTIKQELIEYYPKITADKIAVIRPALNKWINSDPSNEKEVLEKYELPGEYLMTLSTLEPRKNIVNLILGFAEYKKSSGSIARLVVVGKKGWFFSEIFETVKNLGLEEEIMFLGYVPDEELSAIYKNARGFAYLSYYEGFGMPPLEALYFNVPTLLSDIPVFRENFSGLVEFTEYEDPAMIANGIEKILSQRNFDVRDSVVENFNWTKSAQQLLDIINERN